MSTLCLRYEKGSSLNLAPQSTICNYAPGRENQFGTLLIDLLKAFDCIDQKLIIAKLYGYDVSQQIFVLNMSWRRLEHVFDLHLQKTSSRRLQDVLVKTNMFVLVIHLQEVFKRFSRCLYNVFKTFPRRLQDDFKTPYHNVFKTFSRRLQNVLQKRLQDILKTPSSRPQKVFKTSCKNVFKIFSKCLQNVLKTSSRHLQYI